MIEVENTDVNIVRNLIPMRNHMPASAYGLKAISDWFFLNALLKSAKELTHFCWWEHRVRSASRQFLGLDYLVPHILRTLMDRVAKFGL